MDMTKYITKEFLTTEDVKNAGVKTITILNEGEEYTDSWTNKKTRFEVQLVGCGDVKIYTPNSRSVEAMIEQEGSDSSNWRSKQFNLTVELTPNNKEMILVVKK